MAEYLHIKAVEVPIYRGYFVIILTNSQKKVVKYLPEFKGRVYAHSWFATYRGQQGFYIVLNFDNEVRKIKHGVITHEAIHTAHFIATERGIEPDFSNDEAIAYLGEWITDSVYKFIQKHKFSAE